jgi:hypothetical protein
MVSSTFAETRVFSAQSVACCHKASFKITNGNVCVLLSVFDLMNVGNHLIVKFDCRDSIVQLYYNSTSGIHICKHDQPTMYILEQ